MLLLTSAITLLAATTGGAQRTEARAPSVRLLSQVAGSPWRAASHRLGRGRMRAEQVFVERGGFRLRLGAGSCDGAEMRTKARHLHGEFSARMKTPHAPGSLSAFFLYADVSAGNDEIDIEIFNDGSGDALFTTWVDGKRTGELKVALGFDPGATFHEYTIRWLVGELVFLVDGTVRERVRRGYPTAPMRLMANVWWPVWLTCTPPARPAELAIETIRMETGRR